MTWAIAAAATAGVILRPFSWPEFIWAAAGAALLVALGLLSAADALAGVAKGTDVYLFLTGMMVFAELAREVGLFDHVAARAARMAHGSADRLFTLVFAVGTVITVFLSNDAAVVVLTPAVAATARTAEAREPLPYPFTCAFIANAASFVLPISNPANLVIYGDHMPPLLQWLPSYVVPSALSIIATYLVLRWTQRGSLHQKLAADINVPDLSAGGAMAALGIGGTAAVLIASSASGIQLGLPTFLAGAATAVLVLLRAKSSPVPVLKGISWGVLPLVAGLFVLVEAIEKTGVTNDLARLLQDLVQRSASLAAWASGVALSVACNLVNNLPAGLVAGRMAEIAKLPDPMRQAVLIGVDLGPNLSVTGSLATILWVAALRREGQDVSTWRFLKLGMLVMPPALAVALAAIFLPPPHFRSLRLMTSAYLYPFILIAGLLQAAGASMNGQLYKSIPNAWMASAISFGLVFLVFLALSLVLPRPLPTVAGLEGMPWWAPVGGIVGAVAVYASRTFVTRIGAGPFNGLTITANILASLAIDHFGLLRMDMHQLSWQRAVSAVLMVGGVTLVAKF